MPWKVVERRIGRAGGVKQREGRQREWDRKYGENWAVGYVLDGEFVLGDKASNGVLSSTRFGTGSAHVPAIPPDCAT
jgi:hypothetical protein